MSIINKYIMQALLNNCVHKIKTVVYSQPKNSKQGSVKLTLFLVSVNDNQQVQFEEDDDDNDDIDDEQTSVPKYIQ